MKYSDSFSRFITNPNALVVQISRIEIVMKWLPILSLFCDLMEADAIVRPHLLAVLRAEQPLLAEEIDRMWVEYWRHQN